jgi:uncharacterized protein YjbJ (UPF0337 family)
MSASDKVSGRIKQAAGDLIGDERLRRRGADQERKAAAKQELEAAKRDAARSRAEVARLEDETGDTDEDPLDV